MISRFSKVGLVASLMGGSLLLSMPVALAQMVAPLPAPSPVVDPVAQLKFWWGSKPEFEPFLYKDENGNLRSGQSSYNGPFASDYEAYQADQINVKLGLDLDKMHLVSPTPVPTKDPARMVAPSGW